MADKILCRIYLCHFPLRWFDVRFHHCDVGFGFFRPLDLSSMDFQKRLSSLSREIKNKIGQTISEFLDKALQLDKAYLDSEKKLSLFANYDSI